jgi:uncharacterized membrane protein YeaQ/YmgE (transglycosylase-associated protein family)
MLHYVWMFIVGIVVGLLARAIMPGTQHMSLVLTGVLGLAGSFLAGTVTHLIRKPADGAMFHPAGLVMSVIGALVLLFLYTRFGL